MVVRELNLLLLVVGSLLGTALATYLAMVAERKLGYVARDYHKPGEVYVARSGGVALLLMYSLLSVYFAYNSRFTLLAHTLAVVISGFIGLIDDVKGVKATVKFVIFLIPSLPILLLSAYSSSPYVPIVGHLRLSIIYVVYMAAWFTVCANGMNMSDTQNGIAPAITLLFTAFLALNVLSARYPPPLPDFWLFLIISLAVLAGYLPFNMYPAKVFNGNTGSHLLGAIVASLTILSRREFLAVLLLIPFILNGFSILSTLRGFINKERIPRPVKVEEGVIRPNLSRGAPITLVQLLTLIKPMREKELIIAYLVTYVLSMALGSAVYHALLLR